MSEEIINIQNEKLEVRREYWLNHVEEWKRSGLGQVEYCRRTGAKYERLRWWIDRLKKNNQFLPVRIIPEKINSEIEIRLPGSLSVIVKKDFEEDLLRRVIKSLGGYHV
ncbi:MAG TPA: hypothetical protein PLY23_08815 [Alphaproteobacteria bacterium]|nr:hypothetical protein [Alphaproteobacteria bacterium]HQS94699.1 hypothetical protein [Alphaproteobacteria bacterium]